MYNLLITKGNSKIIRETFKDTKIYSITISEKEKIEDFIKSKTLKEYKIMKGKIDCELYKINFNFKYIGTIYLSECIYIYSTLLNNNNEINSINLKSEVFPIIAKKYNTTINSVKTNINRSATNMYYDCNEHYLNEYFNRHLDSKPTLKMLIYTILDKI
ncbi:MAG: hypothetical protein HFJ25_03940 [Clostridia bacterium]|nr:hypothetical protein [Clostridia bacterium]